jgi:uncharacterized protein (TIGR02147 family)
MNEIYNYLDPADYLKDQLAYKKESNNSFSLRSWAKQLGMKSHGPLHAILNKQRKIPKKIVPALLKSLKLKSKEAKYFEVLVDFHRSKSIDEKSYYKDQLEKLSPVPLRELNDLEAYKYITDPVHIILAEMTQLKSFKSDPLWIKQHLRLNQNLKEIEVMVNRLLKLGVVIEKGNKLFKPVEHIYTKYDIKSDAIQQYHKTCSRIAIDEISIQEVAEREFNAIAFNIQKKDLPKMKESIRDFVNQMVEEFEAKPHKGDATYQLNLQLFSLTK